MEIRQRLDLFFSKLDGLPPFESHNHALAEISRVMDEVEEEHSGVPRDLSGVPKRTDGRMYPPHPVYAKKTDLAGVTLYIQTGHQTFIGDGGAVLIINRRTGLMELDRPGSNGERIQL